MSLTYIIDQDILHSPAQTIVNTVNCVGIMGKGLAKRVAYLWPGCLPAYKLACTNRTLRPGKLLLYRRPDGRYILHFPTKDHWQAPSQLEWIEWGLANLVYSYQERGITSIAFPKLGCGNGALSWEQVGPLMAYYLRDLPIPVSIYLERGDQEY